MLYLVIPNEVRDQREAISFRCRWAGCVEIAFNLLFVPLCKSHLAQFGGGTMDTNRAPDALNNDSLPARARPRAGLSLSGRGAIER